jgi:hypothetical protein
MRRYERKVQLIVLKMVAITTSQTLVNVYETAWLNVPEGSYLPCQKFLAIFSLTLKGH